MVNISVKVFKIWGGHDFVTDRQMDGQMDRQTDRLTWQNSVSRVKGRDIKYTSENFCFLTPMSTVVGGEEDNIVWAKTSSCELEVMHVEFLERTHGLKHKGQMLQR